MQWTDWVTICFALFFGLAEARRGLLAALVDVVGIMIGIRAAEALYPHFVSEAAAPVTAYGLVFAGVLVVTFLASWQIQTATARITSPIDLAMAGLVGAVAGLCMGYVLFHALYIAHGDSYPAYADSVLRPIVHDLTWYDSLMVRLGLETGA